MNIWIAKGIVLAASIAIIVIRAPHGERSRSVRIVENRKGTLETLLLTFAMVSFFVPLIWIFTAAFWFAEYPLLLPPLIIGSALLVIGLWLFYRSHADLGRQWSVTLQLREEHQLITHGIYRWMRHPMYAGLLLYSLGQALVIPNWIAGPSYLISLGILVTLRLPAEERMMRDRFGEAYADYATRVNRLVPGVW